jgi:hypothetical protein
MWLFRRPESAETDGVIANPFEIGNLKLPFTGGVPL